MALTAFSSTRSRELFVAVSVGRVKYHLGKGDSGSNRLFWLEFR